MKSKKSFITTAVVQMVYLLCIILNFICIWMFKSTVPYTYPFAIIGSILIFLCPIDFICLIKNLIDAIKDIRASNMHCKLKGRVVLTCMFFIFLCVLKIMLYHYGKILTEII